MKVVQLSASDMIGGASVACRRLHLALRSQGIDSIMGVKISRNSCPGIVTVGSDSGLGAKWRAWRLGRSLARYAGTRPWGLEMFSNPESTRRFSSRDLPSSDVLHMHWATGFLDWRTFFRGLDRPWVWTLHDMNVFTGGCHYTGGCERFVTGCGSCPQLGSRSNRDISYRNWRVKHRMLARRNARRGIIVTPSRWLAEQARNSPILEGLPIEVVPNGLDESVWAPQDPRTARKRLGLSVDKVTILFVSEVVGSRRKGFLELVAALSQLPPDLGCQLVSVGQGTSINGLPVSHRHLGSIRDESRMAEVYSAADLFVIPSLEDNLPNTVMEAMACGTPVLGYAAGGIAELVDDGETGRVVPVGHHEELAQAIITLVRDPPQLRDMGACSRARVLAKYTASAQAKTMACIYEGISRSSGRRVVPEDS